jgi:ElaB/YqjD/DUF883 family membrane-anchored ribosome-binding protein
MQGEHTTDTSNEQKSQVQSIGNPGGSIKEALEPARNKLSSAVSTAKEKSTQLVSGVEGYVHEAPMQSIAMAMGIGVIIGLLLGSAGAASWRSRRSIW